MAPLPRTSRVAARVLLRAHNHYVTAIKLDNTTNFSWRRSASLRGNARRNSQPLVTLASEVLTLSQRIY